MGCGISRCKIDSKDGTTLGCHHFRIVHRKNDRADELLLVLSKPVPEDGQDEQHAKDENMMSSLEGKEGHEKEEKDDDEQDRDDSNHSLECPRSPSFRVFCNSSLRQGDFGKGCCDNAEKIKGKQECDVGNNNKGSSDGMPKRSRAGKGIKSVQQKMK